MDKAEICKKEEECGEFLSSYTIVSGRPVNRVQTGEATQQLFQAAVEYPILCEK